jgi:tRNA1Val (adenine37-N6)-methyltransferase
VNFTDGHLLDGRISYRQSVHGHRTGIEPVLLAAVIPANAGQSVLEAGTGAGASLLCLARRVPGLVATGIEIDPGMAALAAENFRHNRLPALTMIAADLLSAPLTSAHQFDHVLANPPWHDANGTPSPDSVRALAHRATTSLLNDWIMALTDLLRPRGTITLILPAASLGSVLAALVAARCGGRHVLPLWPRQAKPAKLCIVQSRKFARGHDMILPGLTLHENTGKYTAEAERILRQGAGFMM